MEEPASLTIERRDAGSVAVLGGDWTSVSLRGAEERLQEAFHDEPRLGLDIHNIGRCDTAGAYAILEAARDRLPRDQIAARPEIARLLELVQRAKEAEPSPMPVRRPFYEMLTRLGRGVIDVGFDFLDTMAFNGRLIVVTGRVIINPRRIRWAALFSQAERAGLDALPIVAVTTFFIGAVVGLIGANQLTRFGAQVFAVELIGISVLREFGILITAVLLAGRSASSFAAELGAMKMNEEIDAMRVLGVDPFEALVLPRFLALLFTIPILTFVAVIAGLAGGMIITWWALNLSPTFFIQRLSESVGVKQFWIGMSKAPVLAIVIAAIGCRQGMEVGGDVESLGRRVTAAVVHAIFSIILLDAVFALIFMELNI
ncbi:MAG: MlaE family lipid ABC transporter permease subunit [Caulobacteraceae bacterium]